MKFNFFMLNHVLNFQDVNTLTGTIQNPDNQNPVIIHVRRSKS
jgi:hypothetical protein